MFEQQPGAVVVPESMIRNSRTGGWIMTVPNRAFLPPAAARSTAEGRGCVALPRRPAARGSRRIFAVGTIVALLVIAIAGGTLFLW